MRNRCAQCGKRLYGRHHRCASKPQPKRPQPDYKRREAKRREWVWLNMLYEMEVIGMEVITK